MQDRIEAGDEYTEVSGERIVRIESEHAVAEKQYQVLPIMAEVEETIWPDRTYHRLNILAGSLVAASVDLEVTGWERLRDACDEVIHRIEEEVTHA